MSNKYNHSIQFDLDHLTQYEDVLNLEEKKIELDHVYERAAKADEYEAKAKAFDEIFEKYEGVMKEVRNRKFKVTSDVTLLGLEAEKVIKKYESGERNEYQQ